MSDQTVFHVERWPYEFSARTPETVQATRWIASPGGTPGRPTPTPNPQLPNRQPMVPALTIDHRPSTFDHSACTV